MIRLVLSDIDNTLIPLGAPHASKRTIAAIHGLLDAGIEFGPATGRDIDGVERLFGGDAACWHTGLISNGKLIFSKGKLVKTVYLDHEEVAALCAYACALPDAMVLVHTEQGDRYIGAKPELVAASSDLLAPGIPSADKLPEEPITACTLVCSSEPSRSSQIVSEVHRRCSGLECLSPVPGCYDVMPRGYNKASALRSLLEITGISADEVVVFGDSENDVPILSEVKDSVAVSNAMPVAAAAARYHIGACADDAVAAALEEIAVCARTGMRPAFMV